MFFWLSRHLWVKKFATASAKKPSVQSFDSSCTYSPSNSGRTQTSIFFGKSKIQRICAQLCFFETVKITKRRREIVLKFQHSEFCVLRDGKPTMNAFFSISALASSNSNIEFSTWFSFLNNLSSRAACVIPFFMYFFDMCRLQAIFWLPQELLADSFIISATTPELAISSLCVLASTAYCTKLLNNFLGVYSTKRCVSVQTRPNSKQNTSRGVLIVPFCKMKV